VMDIMITIWTTCPTLIHMARKESSNLTQ
jgi:hypothetical protein